MNQIVIPSDAEYRALGEYLARSNMHRVLVVCGKSCGRLRIGQSLNDLAVKIGSELIRFSDFAPNPDYTSVVKGIDVFRVEGCDSILAIGGGSAIDTAKCIKLYATMPAGSDYIHEKIAPNAIPFVAVPTTAGTGSEATRYAVITARLS